MIGEDFYYIFLYVSAFGLSNMLMDKYGKTDIIKLLYYIIILSIGMLGVYYDNFF